MTNKTFGNVIYYLCKLFFDTAVLSKSLCEGEHVIDLFLNGCFSSSSDRTFSFDTNFIIPNLCYVGLEPGIDFLELFE